MDEVGGWVLVMGEGALRCLPRVKNMEVEW